MTHEENIIVSMTSWTPRIGNVKTVLDTLLQQTVKIDKILLNFCIQDFPNMEEDFPEDLVKAIHQNSNVEVYWFIENYKAWKKHLRAVDIAGDNDLIICVDDDCLYPIDFVEKMYKSYCYYGKQYPITSNKYMSQCNLWAFEGPGTLYRKKDFPANYKKYLTQEILRDTVEDLFIQTLFAMNGVMPMPLKYEFPRLEDRTYNEVLPYARGMGDCPERRRIANRSYECINNVLHKKYYNGKETYIKPPVWQVYADFIANLKKNTKYPYPELQYCFKKFYDSYLCESSFEDSEQELNLNFKLH